MKQLQEMRYKFLEKAKEIKEHLKLETVFQKLKKKWNYILTLFALGYVILSRGLGSFPCSKIRL